jgi:hypothetical protein
MHWPLAMNSKGEISFLRMLRSKVHS